MSQTTRPLTRRSFLRRASVAVAGIAGAPYILPASVFGTDAHSKRVTVGFIGCGRQTYHANIPGFLNVAGVQAVAVCDVDSWRMAEAKKLIEGHYAKKKDGSFKGCATYKDFRELLADKGY